MHNGGFVWNRLIEELFNGEFEVVFQPAEITVIVTYIVSDYFYLSTNRKSLTVYRS
jgi:hypothetical protein